MTKRQPLARRPKSASDQAIDKALLAAGVQAGANSGGSIIICLAGKGDAPVAEPPQSQECRVRPD